MKASISSSHISVDSPCEIVWVQLRTTCSNSNIIVGSFYCPPHSPPTIWEDLTACVSKIQQQFPESVILLGGDFNCPGIEWFSVTLTDSYVPKCFRESLIMFSQECLLNRTVL